ncbi:MAG: AAA family ATPase, partial [Alphaproteobacteria bacterium]|nr:AAA family ATPase [Alphaproteobacteria bacterium]
TDVERKRRAGVKLDHPMPGGSYTARASADTYSALVGRAETVLRAGHAVILDAVFARPEERTMAEGLARRVGVSFTGVWLEVAKETAIRRVSNRTADASDATPEVVARQYDYDLGELTWRRQPNG